MSDVAIQIEGLGKRYNIGEDRTRYDTLAEKLKHAVKGPFRRAKSLLRGEAYGAAELHETIWALKDVSLEIERGEVVGVIGKNGAGKSTLLKILARITEPTEGYAEIRGRSGALLEVGTGFHPELTGRENVYLNGAVLGMTKTEIDRKFDQIVDFAGTRKFLDTPVKHYSSGMNVRLAFAVAAHLDPEILLIDEVLSVGDAEFQRKCLGKMNEVAGSGRTVVFVSHRMDSVTELCDRAILLEDGRVAMDDRAEKVVASYLSADSEASGEWVRPDSGEPPEEQDVALLRARILDEQGEAQELVSYGSGFQVEITYEVGQPIRDLAILYGIESHRGLVWQSWDTDSTGLRGQVREPGRYVSVCRVPGELLKPGRYALNLCAHVPGVQTYEVWERTLMFDVSAVGYGFSPERGGTLTPELEWTVRRRESEKIEGVSG
jgi:lipopolysaccharide transport system ATP-binding protein